MLLLMYIFGWLDNLMGPLWSPTAGQWTDWNATCREFLYQLGSLCCSKQLLKIVTVCQNFGAL